MKIITIGREFGSGGREIGRLLAQELGYAYYDKEIVKMIAEKNKMDENYVFYALERGLLKDVPLHFGRTFTYSQPHAIISHETKLLSEQNTLLKELAEKSDCVIVGRAADIILKDYEPFRLFVCADMKAKIERCRKRAENAEDLTDRYLAKKIKSIDAQRKKYHAILSDIPWGDMHGYELCVNTTARELEKMIPSIAQYACAWFDEHGK